MTLCILILNYNTKELLKACIKSAVLNLRKDMEIVVVDNASSDGSVEMLKKDFPKIKIIQNNENLGFSAGNNVGLKKIDAKYYLLLNSDTEVLDNSLEKLVEFAQGNDFGILSCQLEYKNGTFQPNAGNFPFGIALLNWISGVDGVFEKIGINLPSFHRNNISFYNKPKNVDWVSGTAMLIKSETIKKIGYLDEKIFMYGEDVEYCFRAFKKSIYTGWTNDAKIIHFQGGSSKNPSFRQWLGEFRGIIYLYKKYSNTFNLLIVLVLIKLFVIVRIIFYFLIGKINISQTYAKILINT